MASCKNDSLCTLNSKNDRKQHFSCMYCNIFFSIPFLMNRIIRVMFYDTNKQLIKQIVNSQAHSVSYTLSRGNAVVVEYRRDPATDMFQVWIIYKFVSINILKSFLVVLWPPPRGVTKYQNQGFSPATRSLTPGYFHRKRKKNRLKRTSLLFISPFC